MRKLKYVSYTIAFQEVPNEVSLIINISGCENNCDGCHSEYLRKYDGNYLTDDILNIISEYDGMITCVCFMGGDQNKEELLIILRQIKNFCGLKTCLYSGSDNIDELKDMLPSLNYLKVGSYKKRFGGLSSSKTNQKFYLIVDNELIDKTELFQMAIE